ncbi:hypothetical protein COOONC_13862 [Cooperia oncophora]
MSSTLDDFVAEVMSYIAPRKCGGPSTVRVKLFNMMRDISAVRNWADEMAAVMKAEMEEYQTHRKEVLGLIDCVQWLAQKYKKATADHHTEKYWWCRPFTSYGKRSEAKSSVAMCRGAIVPVLNRWELDDEEEWTRLWIAQCTRS